MDVDQIMAVVMSYRNAVDTVREQRSEAFLRECIDMALRHSYNAGWQQGVDEAQRVRSSQWGMLSAGE